MPDDASDHRSLGALLATLPRHLSERAALVGASGRGAGDGGYILYWCHHAMRVRENPALELAAELAVRKRVPLLVFSSLAGANGHTSDRHVTFRLQGFRDLAGQLAAHGIPYACALEAPRRPEGAIDRLAARAAVVVTEDMPAAPYPDWSASLARRTGRPIVLVDTACVVPMNKVDGVFDRAFAFRDATESERGQRVASPWPRCEALDASWPMVDHGVPDVAWQSLDIAELVASLDIDHAVPPVADTVGGTAAGLARWESFRDTRLADYARDRDDAALPGVSRLSAYLHYGMVSPLLVAREAHARGAAKFLEELLVWRELAYHWCRHVADHSSIDAIPAWARRTLAQHAADPRGVHPWERLARGRTGDRLWDLAQRSLLVHGELHNNVRMTWGKAVPQWTRSPEEALATLIDLNNRYALDGSDPASYGGLLWCLGLFDRAFAPEQPVLGAVRPRATEVHAQRLDLEAFAESVQRRAQPLRVAVVGAGISGLACARMLADHLAEVTVFEKSRGSGGRMSTRRGDYGAFDHGAQYFTARDARFAHMVSSWRDEGVVAPWNGRFAEVGASGAEPLEQCRRFVATPSMSALCKHLAEGLAIHCNARVDSIERRDGAWSVRTVAPDGAPSVHGGFDLVLCTAPAPQTALLLGACAPTLAAVASRVAMRATWSMMWASDRRAALPFDHAEILTGAAGVGESLAWVSRISAKPGRADDGLDRWVVLARPEWSEERLERAPAEVCPDIERAFADLGATLGVDLPAPIHATAHRWRFALASREGGAGSMLDTASGIGMAGDWMRGTRVEDAYLSGIALAGRALGAAAQRVHAAAACRAARLRR